MSYYTRTEHDFDHARDLLKHEPRSHERAEVSSQADPDVPGLTGHIITGMSAQDVQTEINRLLWPFGSSPGEGHFTTPRKVGARWVSSGFTQVGRVS